MILTISPFDIIGGDVWNKQPAPKDHPWRSLDPMRSGMVPHYSGTTLDAQKRYADGTIEILNNWLQGKPQNPANLIVENGDYATKAYGQRKK
jgi:formate dehydrogenase